MKHIVAPCLLWHNFCHCTYCGHPASWTVLQQHVSSNLFNKEYGSGLNLLTAMYTSYSNCFLSAILKPFSSSKLKPDKEIREVTVLKVLCSCRSSVNAVSSYELDTHPLPIFLTFLHCFYPSFCSLWLKSSCNSTLYCVLEVGTIPTAIPQHKTCC
jgi:hypothetical protein